MSKSTVQHDFLGIKKIAGKSSSFDQRISIRGIQRAISKLNPQLLKSVIASGSTTASPAIPLPVLNPASRPVLESAPGTAPLTIFYNGTVAVYDVPMDKAEDILRVAEEDVGAAVGSGLHEGLLEKLCVDPPIARKNSLQRFLEKRKERLIASVA